MRRLPPHQKTAGLLRHRCLPDGSKKTPRAASIKLRLGQFRVSRFPRPSCIMMRTMRWRLLTAASFLSAAISVLACALWIRGYFASDMIMHEAYGSTRSSVHVGYVSAYQGWIWGMWCNEDHTPSHPPGPPRRFVFSFGTAATRPPASYWERFHFWMFNHIPRGPVGKDSSGKPLFIQERWDIGVDLFWLTIVAGVLPLVWLVTLRKRLAKLRPGMCKVCGYDLRESRDRCPECGAPIAIAPSNSNVTP
jgi:hypothetical protein